MDPTAKQRLRASTRAARSALSTAQREAASARVVTRLGALPELRRARAVLLYAALRDEVDLGGLLSELQGADTRTLLPRVRGQRLELVAATALHSLEPGFRGVREPVGPSIDPAVVEVALLPGVAFDPRGGRLGSGGGHYDRLLASLPTSTVRIGVGFTCQMVPWVPQEPHDQAMHLVVTDHTVHRAAPPTTG